MLPAKNHKRSSLMNYLALQAEAEEIGAGDGGLVDAQAQAALASGERRRHDLLRLYHLPEQRQVAHGPHKLAAARTAGQPSGPSVALTKGSNLLLNCHTLYDRRVTHR